MKKERNFQLCEFGKVIKKRLVDLGKSQKWLTESIGVSGVTMHAYMKGKSQPEMKNLYKISTVLDINLVELVEILLKEGNTEK